ncbi:MAG: hypothetical protein RIR70_267, partial [Pseudomonadota bacterium]
MGNVVSCFAPNTTRALASGSPGIQHNAGEEKIEFLHDGLIWRSTLGAWHHLPPGFVDASALKHEMPEEFRTHLHRLELQSGGIAQRRIFDSLQQFGTRLTAHTLRGMMLEGRHPELNEALGVLLHYHLLDFGQHHEHDVHCSSGLFGPRHCTLMHRMAVDAREPGDTLGTRLADRFALLARAGVNLDTPCAHHETPLMWAVHWGTLSAAKALILAGADPHQCDHQGIMPLHLAARIGEAHMASFLARAGGSPDVPTHNQHHQTAMHIAAAHGHCRVIRSLQHSGANLDMLDADHKSPLLLAVEHRHHAAIRTLHHYGAQMNLKMGSAAYSALSWAVRHERLAEARVLLECGADPNLRGAGGRTPLHLIALRHFDISHSVPRSLALIDLLLEFGAAMDRADNHGMRAIDIAAKEGNEPVYHHLIKWGAVPRFELDLAVAN